VSRHPVRSIGSCRPDRSVATRASFDTAETRRKDHSGVGNVAAVTNFPAGYQFQTEDEWALTKTRFPLGTLVTGTVIEPYVGRVAFGVWLDLGDNTLGLIRTPKLHRAVSGAASGQTLGGRVISHLLHAFIELSAEQLVSDDFRSLIPPFER
jgi:hypothetical protein